MLKKAFLFLYILGSTTLVFGFPTDSIPSNPAQRDTTIKKLGLIQKLNPEYLASKNLKYLPLPVFSYSPETGFGYGLGLDIFFKNNRYKDDTLSRLSYVYVFAMRTTLKQSFAKTLWNIYGPYERYISKGRVGYINNSEYYFGLGDTPKASKEFLTYTLRLMETRTVFRLKNSYYAGFSFNYSNAQGIGIKNKVISNDILGAQASEVIGLGPALVFDYRNHPYSPTKGWYFEYLSNYYSKNLGSDFSFSEHQFDIRKYYSVFKKGSVGFQYIGQFTTGQVPLVELPRLGGTDILRGFLKGRYRDKQYWASQFEVKYPIHPLVRAAAFGAVGQMAPSFNLFDERPLKSSAGLGLRFLLNKKKEIYSRVDYAYTSDRSGLLYLSFFDAF
jgi:outer membrane protein assembly factor BamA